MQPELNIDEIAKALAQLTQHLKLHLGVLDGPVNGHANDHANGTELRDCRRLLRPLQELTDLITPPEDKAGTLRLRCYELTCVTEAADNGLLRVLCERTSPVPIAELAGEAGIEKGLAGRFMRVLAANGWVDETGVGTYQANDHSRVALRPSCLGGNKFFRDTVAPICGKIGRQAKDGRLVEFVDRSKSQITPFEYTYGAEMFDWLTHDANQESAEAFDAFMTGRRAVNTLQWFETFPAKQKLIERPAGNDPEAAILVDVGGGRGFYTKAFKDSLGPSFGGRFVVQDQAHVVRDSQLEDIEHNAYDFRQPQPVIGARFYLLKTILHDWSDDDSRVILRQVVTAMEPGYSTLLINDFALPETGWNSRQANLDFGMMILSGGKERTGNEWRALLQSVGLKVVKIWTPPTPSGEAVVECEVA